MNVNKKFYIKDGDTKIPVYEDNWIDYLLMEYNNKPSEDNLDDLRPKKLIYVHNHEEAILVKIMMIEEDDNYLKPIFNRMVIGKLVEELKNDRIYRDGYIVFQIRNIMEIVKIDDN